MTVLYPPIEPHDQGLLDVGDANAVYWEVCGNPQGKPVLVLHGGPGSGSSPRVRRFFDPEAYRIVLFDQRGCGRSWPHASDAAVDLSVNTTPHLLGDIELLRRHLEVDRWLLFGHSWGTTLALAYAQANPARVVALILVGVTTTRRSEIDWLYRGLAPLFPEQWHRFRLGVPQHLRDGDLVAAYRDLVNDPDPKIAAKAARDWHEWEAATITIDPDAKPPARWVDDDYILARTRIITHYFHNNAWLDDGILLRQAHLLAGLPGVMIQGRLDLEAPLTTAWELSRVWSDGILEVIQNAGHSTSDSMVSNAIVAASNRLLGVTSDPAPRVLQSRS